MAARKPKRPLTPGEIREVLALVKLCVSQRRPYLRRSHNISTTWDKISQSWIEKHLGLIHK